MQTFNQIPNLLKGSKILKIRHTAATLPGKFLVLLTLFVIVLSSTAAAADYHPGGYDEECALCQINHLPLAETVATAVIPEITVICWLDSQSNMPATGNVYRISPPGRSPPTC